MHFPEGTQKCMIIVNDSFRTEPFPSQRRYNNETVRTLISEQVVWEMIYKHLTICDCQL